MDQTTLARIRLVTREYSRLQGLSTVAVGVVYLTFAGLGRWLWPDSRLTLGVPALLILVATHVWLERVYYPSRFGRVLQREEEPAGKVLAGVLGLVAALILDRQTIGLGVPAVTPLVYASGSMRALYRGWPLRTHHAAMVLAAIFMSVRWMDTTLATEREWFIGGAVMFGVAHVIAGLGDHWLLTKTLGWPQEAAEESHE